MGLDGYVPTRHAGVGGKGAWERFLGDFAGNRHFRRLQRKGVIDGEPGFVVAAEIAQ